MSENSLCSSMVTKVAVVLVERFVEATSQASIGNFQQALILFQKLLVDCPQEYTLRNNCGWLLKKLGCYAEAEAVYRAFMKTCQVMLKQRCSGMVFQWSLTGTTGPLPVISFICC